MEILTIVFIAVGLSMDSFAVSVANGLAGKLKSPVDGMRMAVLFAVVQGIMPVIGWLAGMSIRQYIEAVDHWVAFGLLFIIGLRMILESFGGKNKSNEQKLKRSTVLLQALATSIDALVVGIGFAMLEVSIVLSALIIAAMTLVFSLTGVYLGNYLGSKIEKPANILGGLVLMAIGVKILVEHGCAIF